MSIEIIINGNSSAVDQLLMHIKFIA